MIINAIRFKALDSDNWRTWRFTTGSGNYRDFICLQAESETLAKVAAAIRFSLTGQEAAGISESSVQISDNSGDYWVVHRKEDQVKYLKNGNHQEGNVEAEFLEAILDSEVGREATKVSEYNIDERSGQYVGTPLEQSDDPRAFLKDVVSEQITLLASQCARTSGIDELRHPKLLSQLMRRIEPLIKRYEALRQTAREVETEIKKFGPGKMESIEQVQAELEQIERLNSLAKPLLDPAQSLKLKRSQLKSVEAKIHGLQAELEIDARIQDLRLKDWRKPLESIARMEAFAKLVHASAGARKYCHQKVEPSYKSYIGAIRKSIEKDRSVAAELESCLASLNLYCGIANDPKGNIKTRNWFDKFKAKHLEEGSQVLDQSQVDTIRMAIEYVLGRLNDMQRRAMDAGDKHDTVQGRIDDAHEELVQSFGGLQSHWQKVATKYQIPEDIGLNDLIKHICSQSELVALQAERELLNAQLEGHREKLKSLKTEIQAWRKLTGSQKQTELSTEAFILTEARDILNFLPKRRNQLKQWQEKAAESMAAEAMRSMVRKSKERFDIEWSAAFTELDLEPVSIKEAFWKEMINRAGLMRSLALIHTSTGVANAHKVFVDCEESAAANIYHWQKGTVEPFLKYVQAKAAEGVENLQVILVEDECAFDELKSLGLGAAKMVVAKPGAAAAVPEVPTLEVPEAPQRPSAVQLNERARAALQILTGNK